MNYGKGTIIFATRTQFGDNGRYDNRIGHPGMLPIASDDTTNETYYLMLTSRVDKINIYPEQYFDLSNEWRNIPLQKPSLINLQYIYKGHINGNKLGGLYPKLYKNVIQKLKEYQSKCPCELYEEIKNYI